MSRRGLVADPALEHVEAADDRHQQVVEVVRHAARELAHALQLLALAQRLLRLLQLGRGELLGRHVPPDRVKHLSLRDEAPGDPPPRTVRMAQPILEMGNRLPASQPLHECPDCRVIVRVDLFPERQGQQRRLVEAEHRLPGRVDRLGVPVKAHDREQIGRVVPDPVALRRSRGDALLERLVESAQLLLARPERGLGPPGRAGVAVEGGHPAGHRVDAQRQPEVMARGRINVVVVELDRNPFGHRAAVGRLDRGANRRRGHLPMGSADEFRRRTTVQPQSLGIDLGDAVILVENDESFAHRIQHAGVAGIAGLDRRRGEIGLGDVVALAEDAGDPSGLVPDGLVDEVEEDLLRRFGRRGVQAGRDMAGDEALAGGVDLVEPLVEALSLEFGKHIADGPADEVAVAEQAAVGLVDELEPVLGSVQDRDEAGRLLE
jgi:hypothetical protein